MKLTCSECGYAGKVWEYVVTHYGNIKVENTTIDHEEVTTYISLKCPCCSKPVRIKNSQSQNLIEYLKNIYHKEEENIENGDEPRD